MVDHEGKGFNSMPIMLIRMPIQPREQLVLARAIVSIQTGQTLIFKTSLLDKILLKLARLAQMLRQHHRAYSSRRVISVAFHPWMVILAKSSRKRMDAWCKTTFKEPTSFSTKALVRRT